MKVRGFTVQQVFGDSVLERISRSPHAGAMKQPAQAFKATQARFSKACDQVAAAEGRRDDALAAITAADDRLDGAILALADRLVGAGLGKRQQPFAAFKAEAPSTLTRLGYAAEVKAATALVAKLRKRKQPTEVAAAVKAVADGCAGVAKALKGLAGPQAAYEAAMQARDALLLDWNKALGRLKRQAAVAYDEDRAGLRALFAPAQDLQAPRPRPRKKPTPPASPAPTDG